MTATKTKPTTFELTAAAAHDFWLCANVVGAFASTDDFRPMLECIRIRSADGKVRFTATDSYALAEAEMTAPPELPEFDVLVHAGWLRRSMPKKRPALGASFVVVFNNDGRHEWRNAQTGEAFTREMRLKVAEYPNTDGLLASQAPADPDNHEPRAYNPKLLSRTLTQCHKFGGDASPVRIGSGFDIHKATQFLVVGGPGRLTVLQMPVRVP